MYLKKRINLRIKRQCYDWLKTKSLTEKTSIGRLIDGLVCSEIKKRSLHNDYNVKDLGGNNV